MPPVPHVALVELDETTLEPLLAAAVEGAEPAEVMAPLAAERGWSDRQQEAFRSFHRSRSLGTGPPVEHTCVVLADGQVAGAVRREPTPGCTELGIWLAQRWRGQGVGSRAVRLLVERSSDRELVAATTSANRAAVRLLRSLGAELHADGPDVHARWVVRSLGQDTRSGEEPG